MAYPIVWGELPESQSDNTTIAEAIAAAIAAHEADPDAHYAAGAAIDIHRTSDVIDHPAGSVLPDKMTDDIIGIGKTAGTFSKVAGAYTQVSSSPAADYWTGCYLDFATPLYFVAGAAGVNATSSDGDTWTAGAAITTARVQNCKFGNGVAVIGVSSETDKPLRYSTDGITWTPIIMSGYSQCTGLIFDGTRFLATVSNTGSPSYLSALFSSTDGVSWSFVTTNLTHYFENITGEDPGMAYNIYSNGNLYSSLDAITWTFCLGPSGGLQINGAASLPGFAISSTAYDFLDYDSNEIVIPACFVSSDGLGWSQESVLNGGNFWALIYAGQNYIAATNLSTDAAISSSGNGQIWTASPTPLTTNIRALFASPTRIIAIGSGAVANNICYLDI